MGAGASTRFNGGSVRRSLGEKQEYLLVLLDRLQGRQEWGLKIFCDEARLRATIGAANSEVQTLDAAATPAGPGQRYILGKKREARCAEVASARIDDVVDEIIGFLEPLPIETRFKPPLSGRATGRGETMVLNLAVLVGAVALDAFHAAVEDLASRFAHDGFAFEVSGPWPAYSFCGDDDAGEIDKAGADERETSVRQRLETAPQTD